VILIPLFRLVWVACCAVTLLAQTRLLLNLPLMPGWIDGFVFGATVFGYHCTHPDLLLRRMAWGMGAIGALALAGFVLTAANPAPALIITGLSALLWLGYYGFKRPGRQGLRARPMAKPLVVAFTWALITVLLPAPPETWPGLWAMLAGRISFIFALALAYDLHDVPYDQRRGLPTLAAHMGKIRALWLIFTAIAISGIFIAVNLFTGFYPLKSAAGLWGSLLIGAPLLHFFLQYRSLAPWRKLLIDALMPFQFVCVWLSSRFG
jgi:4-hydroxybenzoate polyprenyltransferase